MGYVMIQNHYRITGVYKTTYNWRPPCRRRSLPRKIGEVLLVLSMMDVSCKLLLEPLLWRVQARMVIFSVEKQMVGSGRLTKNTGNVSKAAINHPYFDGWYHLFILKGCWFLGRVRSTSALPSKQQLENQLEHIEVVWWQLVTLNNFSSWWLTYPSGKYESELGWLFSIYGKITNIPNHQPEFTGTHTPSSGVKSPAGIVWVHRGSDPRSHMTENMCPLCFHRVKLTETILQRWILKVPSWNQTCLNGKNAQLTLW